ncbi:MAG: hypothetical protein GXP00_00330 [Alphaproteobacteria bacterium]|nr:hypothetical protein [Alphaproteobacteria bacterium]
MTEEVPKNSPFLKFIVIFMGILIAVGLAVVVWKVIDLAQQKAAREKREAAELVQPASQLPEQPFAFDVTLAAGEVILESTAAPGGLWLRIGRDDKTSRMIFMDYAGKTLGRIKVIHEDPESAN